MYETERVGLIWCPVCNRKVDDRWFLGIEEHGAKYRGLCIRCGEDFIVCVKNYKIYEDEDGEMYIE